tara:strand:- start:81 stop:713 length:633 start_codon:yes stop_codon:yes gene_type:complete
LKLKNLKKIVVIGNSKKFVFEVKKNFKYEILDIIPWRKINLFLKKKKLVYDLVIICGFDFGIYKKKIKLFEQKNIYYPLRLLRKISNNKTKFVYINTQNYSSKNYTLSRYKYAKQKLAYVIDQNFKNLVTINSDLITLNKNISINSKNLSQFIFLILVRLGFLKTIEIKKIFLEIKEKLESKFYQKQKNIKGFFLYFPRTQFLDRLLRLF